MLEARRAATLRGGACRQQDLEMHSASGMLVTLLLDLEAGHTGSCSVYENLPRYGLRFAYYMPIVHQ